MDVFFDTIEARRAQVEARRLHRVCPFLRAGDRAVMAPGLDAQESGLPARWRVQPPKLFRRDTPPPLDISALARARPPPSPGTQNKAATKTEGPHSLPTRMLPAPPPPSRARCVVVAWSERLAGSLRVARARARARPLETGNSPLKKKRKYKMLRPPACSHGPICKPGRCFYFFFFFFGVVFWVRVHCACSRPAGLERKRVE